MTLGQRLRQPGGGTPSPAESESRLSACPPKSCAALFFGMDLQEGAVETLLEVSTAGHALIALDSSALVWAARKGLPCSPLESWLKPGDLRKAKIRAAELEESWFLPARESFVVNGLCWPEFDREALYAYWRTVSVAEALGDALYNHEVRQLTVFRHDPPRPMIYYDPADVHATHLEGTFKGTVKCVVHRHAPPVPDVPCPPAADPAFFLHNNVEMLRGKTLICLNPFEVFRFARHIETIKAAFGSKVILVANTHLARDVADISETTRLPVLCLGPAGQPATDVTGRCRQGFARILEHGDAPSTAMLRSNAPHFDVLFRSRWPWLQATLDYWTRAFQAAPPALVVCSTLEDSESQIPAEAAFRAGVPSLSLPHGIGMTRTIRPKTTTVLFHCEVDKEAYLRSGVARERLVGCGDLLTMNEYPVSEDQKLPHPAQGMSVLVITGPTCGQGLLYPFIDKNTQLRALRCLASPPADLAKQVTLTIKPHPGLPDLEILEAAGPAVSRLSAPLDLPLGQALEAADLVISLNYIGIAILHCAEYGKPLLQFRLDPDVGSVEPLAFGERYSSAGDVIDKENDLWPAIRRFRDDPEYRESLLRRIRAYHAAVFSEKHSSLAEILQSMTTAAGRED
jgi:hypothetical protein